MTTDARRDSASATKGTLRWRGAAMDAAIALMVALLAGLWATSFWNTWTARGNAGGFYQTYFEPAVMVACGKGFVISQQGQPQALEDFLFQRRDAITCADLPPDSQLGTRYLYQGAWTYLLYTIGLAWRIVGISWSGMGPIFGAAFGVVIAVAYALFRFGMGRAVALGCAAALTVSSMHLLNLPHLRDYFKAPFTLALVLLLGLLVTLPVRAWLVATLAVGYGIVLGIGYGFRTDFLINVPVFLFTLFAFLDGGLTRNLKLKAASAVLFLVTFIAVSWPITSTVYTAGGCQWHVTLLGLQSPFDGYLRVASAPYDFGHAYSDSYIDRAVNGFRWRQEPGAPALIFCSHEYDVQSGAYLQAILRQFPADFIARAYASVLQVVEMPFHNFLPPMADWYSPLYAARAWLLEPTHRWGLWATVAAVLAIGAVNVRLAAFAMFFLAYFGGYPAIQFQERHYFHLEFIGWWVLGFAVHHAVTTAWAIRRDGWPEVAALRQPLLRSVACAGVALALAAGALVVARWYQAGQARTLLAGYIAAPKDAVTAPDAALSGIGATEWPQLLEVQLDPSACGERPSVTFKYDKTEIGLDFTRTVTVERAAAGSGAIRIFEPVFQKYAGLELADPKPGCLIGVSRVIDTTPFPLLLGATLPAGWDTLPLYQRLADWE